MKVGGGGKVGTRDWKLLVAYLSEVQRHTLKQADRARQSERLRMH